jgi:hypothetical protein
MKLANIVNLKSKTTVDDGKDLDNVFVNKSPKVKRKVPSIKKGPYGGVGYYYPLPMGGTDTTGGEASDGGGGGGGGAGGAI